MFNELYGSTTDTLAKVVSRVYTYLYCLFFLIVVARMALAIVGFYVMFDADDEAERKKHNKKKHMRADAIIKAEEDIAKLRQEEDACRYPSDRDNTGSNTLNDDIGFHSISSSGGNAYTSTPPVPRASFTASMRPNAGLKPPRHPPRPRHAAHPSSARKRSSQRSLRSQTDNTELLSVNNTELLSPVSPVSPVPVDVPAPVPMSTESGVVSPLSDAASTPASSASSALGEEGDAGEDAVDAMEAVGSSEDEVDSGSDDNVKPMVAAGEAAASEMDGPDTAYDSVVGLSVSPVSSGELRGVEDRSG
jgi:hypothetical protein